MCRRCVCDTVADVCLCETPDLKCVGLSPPAYYTSIRYTTGWALCHLINIHEPIRFIMPLPLHTKTLVREAFVKRNSIIVPADSIVCLHTVTALLKLCKSRNRCKHTQRIDLNTIIYF